MIVIVEVAGIVEVLIGGAVVFVSVVLICGVQEVEGIVDDPSLFIAVEYVLIVGNVVSTFLSNGYHLVIGYLLHWQTFLQKNIFINLCIL